MKVGEESNREKLAKEDMIKELKKRVRHLELEQSLPFVELRYSTSLAILVGLFGHEQATSMEEDIVEQHFEHVMRVYPSILSYVARRKKPHLHNHENKNV
jgi:hypothetical protein